MKNPIVIGTRGSDLALWQANHVKAQLENLRKEVSDLRKENMDLARKKDDATWIAKSEYERIEKLLKEKEKELERMKRESS